MSSSAATLPPLLELHVNLPGTVRCPGSILSGSVSVGVASAASLHRLAPACEEQRLSQLQQQQASAQPSVKQRPDDVKDESERASLLGRQQASASSASIAAAASPLQPLSRPFNLEIRLQLIGKCIYDPSKLSAKAMRQFHLPPVATVGGEGANPSHAAAGGKTISNPPANFKIWSTRVSRILIDDADIQAQTQTPAPSPSPDTEPEMQAAYSYVTPRCFAFRASLPLDLLPSFRGVAVRHVYFFHLICLRGGTKLTDVKLPFQVRLSGTCGGEFVPSLGRIVLDTPLHHVRGAMSPWSVVEINRSTHMGREVDGRQRRVSNATADQSQHSTISAQSSTSTSRQDDDLSSLNDSTGSESERTPRQQVRLLPPSSSPSLPVSSVGVGAASSTSSSSTTPALDLSSSPSPFTPMIATDVSRADGDRVEDGSISSSVSGSVSGSVSATGAADDVDVDPFDLPPFTQPLTFNISKSLQLPKPGGASGEVDEISAHVVRLTLDSSHHYPGQTISGHMDFSHANIRCYRVAIRLEQIEEIMEEFMTDNTANNKQATAQPFKNVKTYWTFHQYTLNTLSTHFTFSLPFDGVSNFQTDIFRVSWYLRFTFITDIQPPTPDSSWSFLPAPSTTKAEALHWNLPLTVLPHAYEDDTRRQTNSKTIFITPQGVV